MSLVALTFMIVEVSYLITIINLHFVSERLPVMLLESRERNFHCPDDRLINTFIKIDLRKTRNLLAWKF